LPVARNHQPLRAAVPTPGRDDAASSRATVRGVPPARGRSVDVQGGKPAARRVSDAPARQSVARPGPRPRGAARLGCARWAGDGRPRHRVARAPVGRARRDDSERRPGEDRAVRPRSEGAVADGASAGESSDAAQDRPCRTYPRSYKPEPPGDCRAEPASRAAANSRSRGLSVFRAPALRRAVDADRAVGPARAPHRGRVSSAGARVLGRARLTVPDDPFAALGLDRTVLMPVPGGRTGPPGPVAPETTEMVEPAGVTSGLNPLVAAANPLLDVVAQIRATVQHPNPTALRDCLAQ